MRFPSDSNNTNTWHNIITGRLVPGINCFRNLSRSNLWFLYTYTYNIIIKKTFQISERRRWRVFMPITIIPYPSTRRNFCDRTALICKNNRFRGERTNRRSSARVVFPFLMQILMVFNFPKNVCTRCVRY